MIKKIKFLLEEKGHGRVTDQQLAEMFGVKKDTISRWKIKPPALFEKIKNTGLTFEQVVFLDNKEFVKLIKLNPLMAYNWNKKRPNLLTKTYEFTTKYKIDFESFY